LVQPKAATPLLAQEGLGVVEPPPLNPVLGEEGNLLLNSPPAANTLGQGRVERDPPWMTFSVCAANLNALRERI